MGNRPKPAALRLLEGNRGKRPIPPENPNLPVEEPFCPEHLGVAAKEVWKRKVREHIDAGTLTKLDGDLLAGYCEMYAMSASLSDAINAPEWAPAVIEAVVDSDGGTQPRIKANPLIDAKLKVLREMRLHLIEFGDTPASRSKVLPTGKDAVKSPFQRFQAKRQAVTVPAPDHAATCPN